MFRCHLQNIKRNKSGLVDFLNLAKIWQLWKKKQDCEMNRTTNKRTLWDPWNSKKNKFCETFQGTNHHPVCSNNAWTDKGVIEVQLRSSSLNWDNGFELVKWTPMTLSWVPQHLYNEHGITFVNIDFTLIKLSWAEWNSIPLLKRYFALRTGLYSTFKFLI